jgi:hypothetical protein
MAALFAVALLTQAVRQKSLRLALYAAISLAGFVAYLGYVFWRFGNPLTLFPAIQIASWGLFHPPVQLVSLLTGEYLWRYWALFFERNWMDWGNIKTLNLVWTSLGLVSCVYLLAAWRRELWAWLFIFYCLFIYATNSGSEYLISAHRFFLLMVPIFMMVVAGHGWLARRVSKVVAHAMGAVILALNLVYGIFHAGFFNQGIWYYF